MVSSPQLEEMRGKLIEVADDPRRPDPGGRARRRGGRRSRGHATDATDATDDPGATDAAETPVDPRYEALWVQKDESLQIPDLASIDLEFDEPDE